MGDRHDVPRRILAVSRRILLGVGVLAGFACGGDAPRPAGPVVPAVRAAVEPAPVVVGEWTIRSNRSVLGFAGRAERTGEGSRETCSVDLIPTWMVHRRPSDREIELPDGRNVIVGTGFVIHPVESREPPAFPDEVKMERAFASPLAGEKLSFLVHRQGWLREKVAAKTPEAVAEARRALSERLFATAEEDPAFQCLRDLLAERVVLTSHVQPSGRPAVSASVDGGPFTRLNGRDPYLLPARPGQTVRFRVEVQAVRRTVTSHGIEEAPADLTETDARLLAALSFARFGAGGVAELGPIEIESPRAIRLVVDYAPGVSHELTVVLRGTGRGRARMRRSATR